MNVQLKWNNKWRKLDPLQYNWTNIQPHDSKSHKHGIVEPNQCIIQEIESNHNEKHMTGYNKSNGMQWWKQFIEFQMGERWNTFVVIC